MHPAHTLVHIARHASDRLAPRLSPDLPVAVTRALADADPRVAPTGRDGPRAADAAALVVRCATVGWEAVSQQRLGQADHLSPAQLRRVLALQLRLAAEPPAGMSRVTYEEVLDVVIDEIVVACHRVPQGR